MNKHVRRTFEQSTEASAENRDAQGRPLPKLPAGPARAAGPVPRLAWSRMLARGRRHATAASISSLLRFRRLRLPAPEITAPREPVRQFRGMGFGIQVAGLLAWPALWWAYDLAGAAIGAGVCLACQLIGRAKSKPWRCGHCRTPLATAKVRVCPGCGARLVDLGGARPVLRA